MINNPIPHLLRQFAFAVTCCSIGAQDPTLTVADIEMLLSVKMTDDVIIAKAKRSGKPVELSTEEMIHLKKAGASDNLIRQLLTVGTAPGLSEAVPANTQALAAARRELGVYYKTGQIWMELLTEVVNFKSSGLLKAYTFRMDLNGMIAGASSKKTLKTPIEILLVTPEGVNANEYQLVRLKAKGTQREFRYMSSGVGGAKSGVERDAVAFDFRKLEPGQFSISLPSSVVAGEYAFLPPMGPVGGGLGGPGATMGKAYTFRVLE
jgi:hypothetical protein